MARSQAAPRALFSSVAIATLLIASTASANERSFQQGTWSMTGYGNWIGDEWNTIVSGHVGLSFHPLDAFAITLEAGGYQIWRAEAQGGAASGDLLLRWYALRHEWFAFFVEAGCGVIVAEIPLPAQTSTWNFTPQARAGMTFEVAPHLHAFMLAGWWHASTAGIEQPNPGFNGASVAMGMMISEL